MIEGPTSHNAHDEQQGTTLYIKVNNVPKVEPLDTSPRQEKMTTPADTVRTPREKVVTPRDLNTGRSVMTSDRPGDVTNRTANDDENDNNDDVENDGEKNSKLQKLHKRSSSKSLGIFAPPLNPKPKTRAQAVKLVKKHSDPQIMRIKHAQDEPKINEVDVAIVKNDKSIGARLKLTTPQISATRVNLVTADIANMHDFDDTTSPAYVTSLDPITEGLSEGDQSSENLNNTKSNRNIHREESVVSNGSTGKDATRLPDIRFNNYNTPTSKAGHERDQPLQVCCLISFEEHLF